MNPPAFPYTKDKIRSFLRTRNKSDFYKLANVLARNVLEKERSMKKIYEIFSYLDYLSVKNCMVKR